MLEADLQRLRDDNTAIAQLLQELENNLALPLPPEPPFQVISGVTARHDHVHVRHRQLKELRYVPPWTIGSASRRNAGDVGPGREGLGPSLSMISGVGVSRTAEEVRDLIMNREEALGLTG